MKQQREHMLLMFAAAVFIVVVIVLPRLTEAGSLEPTAAPGPTMKTLNEIPPTWSQKLDSTNGSIMFGREGCDSSRFECIMYEGTPPIPQAVLDNETGLVWARDANLALTRGDDTDGRKSWIYAMQYVLSLNLGNRRGWRLPTAAELASLIDDTQPSPSLPNGHPFRNVQSSHYWTTTENEGNFAWAISMEQNSIYGSHDKSDLYYMWPVRGGR